MLRSTVENRTWKQSAWQGRFRKDGRSYFAVKVVLEGRGAALIQVMPESTFLQQRRVYLWLLGLGLAIVKHIATNSGASVTVTAAPDGNTFTVLFPVQD